MTKCIFVELTFLVADRNGITKTEDSIEGIRGLCAQTHAHREPFFIFTICGQFSDFDLNYKSSSNCELCACCKCIVKFPLLFERTEPLVRKRVIAVCIEQRDLIFSLNGLVVELRTWCVAFNALAITIAHRPVSHLRLCKIKCYVLH